MTHIPISAPDQSDRAAHLIELTLASDPEARDRATARLIAATMHSGRESALYRFATTGQLDHELVLSELNTVVVDFDREGWVDGLGRYVLLSAGEKL